MKTKGAFETVWGIMLPYNIGPKEVEVGQDFELNFGLWNLRVETTGVTCAVISFPDDLHEQHHQD